MDVKLRDAFRRVYIQLWYEEDAVPDFVRKNRENEKYG